MSTGILIVRCKYRRYALFVLLAFAWALLFGCNRLSSAQRNQPPSESFAQVLSSIGIQMGKPFVVPQGSKVIKRPAPLSNIFPDYSSVEFKNARLYLDKNGNVRLVDLQSPELAAYGKDQLTSIARSTSEGKDIFELSNSDIIRLFGYPSYISKQDKTANHRNPPSYAYYCYTNNEEVIGVSCTFSRGADGNIKLYSLQINYVEQADRRAYLMTPGKFQLYSWPSGH
jgi:hypothetical protein